MDQELMDKIIPHLRMILTEEDRKNLQVYFNNVYRIGTPPYTEIVLYTPGVEAPTPSFLELTGNFYNMYDAEEMEQIIANGEKL